MRSNGSWKYGVTQSIIDEVNSLHVQGGQMEGASGVTGSIIDEPHSWDIQGYQMEAESMVLLEVSLLNFILGRTKKIKWKGKLV